jgi:hypothetical protein
MFFRRRDEFNRYLERRDAEARERAEEGRAHWAELQGLREQAEAREEKAAAREEETREFNREILLRNEKVYTSVIVELEKGARQLEEGTKQIQANTKAILSVLDRLNGSSA